MSKQIADANCKYVSKANPADPAAYRRCVDNYLYNYYTFECQFSSDSKARGTIKEQCKNLRKTYLETRASMLQIPQRNQYRKDAWNGVTFEEAVAAVEDHMKRAYNFEKPASKEQKAAAEPASTKTAAASTETPTPNAPRASARRRGSARKAVRRSSLRRRRSFRK